MAGQEKFDFAAVKRTMLMVAATFLVAFVGGVSGWKIADSSQTDGSRQTNTVFVDSGSGSVADVVAAASKGVVSIDAGSVQTAGSFFFGSQRYEVVGSGSGFIVSSDGIIITNKHVVDEDTTSITVTDVDGNEYTDVELIGTDPFNDIAFLRIKGSHQLTALPLGDSDRMRVGDEVIAIGNALGVYANTVTKGIISGTGRPIQGAIGNQLETLFDLFQTDAAINQGNSGGPLINASGQVIGINTAIAGQAQNIGFAIPINDVKSLLSSIVRTGELQRPYIGVRYILLTPDLAESLDLPVDEGALIDADPGQPAVIKDSPADKAGIREGDIIIEINGEAVNADNPPISSINGLAVGDEVTIKIIRDGKEKTFTLTLEAVPEGL